MVKWLTIIAVFLLMACGGAPTVVPTPLPTTTPAPTFTAAERAAFETIAQRSAAMQTAGKALVTLGQAVRADTAWRTQARTAAQVLTGSQKVISAAQLPALYAPLSQRAADVTRQCAAAAEAILAIDVTALTIGNVAGQRETIERWCMTEMGRLQQQAEHP